MIRDPRRELWVLMPVVAGLGALSFSSSVVGLLAFVGLVICLAAPFLRRWTADWPWGVLTLCVCVGLTAAVVRAPHLLRGALAAGLIYLQAQRSLARMGPRDDRVSVLLSALMLVLGALDAPGLGFGLVILVWLVATPLALALGTLEEAGVRRTAGRDAALPLGPWGIGGIVALAAVLFLGVPRLGPGRAGGGAGTALTGFQPEVALGDLGVLLDDPTIVLRASVAGPVRRPLYLRGTALDAFDGTRWTTSTASEPFEAVDLPAVPLDAIQLRVRQEQSADGVLFMLGAPIAVSAGERAIRRDGDGNFWVGPGSGLLAYRVAAVSAPLPAGPVTAADRQRWTALPADLNPAITALAVSWTQGLSDPEARARAIAGHLVTEYAYTRAPRDHAVEGPIETFLFSRRTGHCEYFASAAVVLLRSVDVPARLVNGFVTNEIAPTGEIVARRSHAHAWIEVLSTEAWIPVDVTPGPGIAPTPGTVARVWESADDLWRQQIVGYDLGVQTGIVVGGGRWLQAALTGVPDSPDAPPWFGLALEILALGAVTGLAGLGLRRRLQGLAGEERPRTPEGRVARIHTRARNLLSSRGWRPPSVLPPVEAAQWIRARAGEPAAPLEELAWLHYEVRYGGADDASLAVTAQHHLEALGAVPPAG